MKLYPNIHFTLYPGGVIFDSSWRGPVFYQALIISEQPNAQLVEMYSFPSHWHSEIEIIYCLAGSFNAIIDGQNFTLSAGQTLFIASAEPHEYTDIGQGTKCLLIEIGAGFLKQNFQEFTERCFNQTVMEIIPSRIRYLFDTIIAELNQPGMAGGELIVTGCLFELAAHILRDIPGKEDKSSQRHERIRAMQRMGKLMEYIQNNYQKQITIEDAAMQVAYEKSNFCKQFKKATQMTFHQYLNMIRISKACILLNDTNYTINDVAEKTGFPETKTFCRVFKELMKNTPGKYRTLHNP